MGIRAVRADASDRRRHYPQGEGFVRRYSFFTYHICVYSLCCYGGSGILVS